MCACVCVCGIKCNCINENCMTVAECDDTESSLTWLGSSYKIKINCTNSHIYKKSSSEINRVFFSFWKKEAKRTEVVQEIRGVALHWIINKNEMVEMRHLFE